MILGNCLPGETVTLKDESGFAGKEIERETLNTIIHMRMRESLELLKRELDRETYLDFIGAGIFITGGLQFAHWASTTWPARFSGTPVHAAHAQSMSGLTSAFENPQLATAIGLIKYAQMQPGRRTSATPGGFLR